MSNQSFEVFKNVYLSTVSGFASSIMSPPMPVIGNKIVVPTLCKNITSGGTLTVKLHYTYDGKAWQVYVPENSLTAFGYDDDLAVSGVDAAFVRLVATLTGTDEEALLDSSIAFSHQ